MPVYRVTGKAFEALEETSFEAERLLERSDLQRRLLDSPEILEEGLFILDEEYSNWEESNRRIDLLALDNTGRLVVVELKRSDSDSFMDLQAIRYAAMVANMTLEQAVDAHRQYLRRRNQDETEAESRIREHLPADDAEVDINSSKPRIILVSANFSRELTTSVMWLNEFDNMDITCVKLQPYKSENEVFLECTTVIPIPEADDYLVRLRHREDEVQRRQAAGTTIFARFYRPLTAELRDLGIYAIGGGQRGWTGRYRRYRSGTFSQETGVTYYFTLGRGSEQCEVGLFFNGSNHLDVYNALLSHRSELESAMNGIKIIGEERQTQSWVYVYTAGIPDEEEVTLEATRKWMKDTLVGFRDILEPKLKAIVNGTAETAVKADD